MSAREPVLDTRWTDDDGEPLGGWVEIGLDEWQAIIADAGGLEALTVFSGLTDPEGVYGGAPRIYTSWGRPDGRHPLVDVEDLKEDWGEWPRRTIRSTFRRFVLLDGTEARA